MHIKKLSQWLICGLLAAVLLWSPALSRAEKEKPGAYEFTVTKELGHTPVKNQARTGTCWCFATVSFLESETLRLGGESLDLSEMFIVNYNYRDKAENFVRMHGNATFGQGSLGHDVMKQLRNHGIVPESVYSGMVLGYDHHDHNELFRALKGVVDAVVAARRPTIRWKDAFAGVINAYLGAPPDNFTYQGQFYTPKSFAENVVMVNPDDYVEVTSFTYAPFYKQCVVKVPDNWWYNDEFYNVPLDDLERIADHALENGYTVAWDGDVSEKHFSSRDKGYALLPKEDIEGEITEPVEEMDVTQENRQKSFDSYITTDDHLMHVVGLAKDQNGKTYYYIKNSGGDRGPYNGYLFMSKPYYRMKTVAIMVHKDAIPSDIKAKLGL